MVIKMLLQLELVVSYILLLIDNLNDSKVAFNFFEWGLKNTNFHFCCAFKAEVKYIYFHFCYTQSL